ncbi:MAG: crotonase/enoyl-CoA hydratase family protein [Proteobacteria bacterium]|nr:enoyl-CoA hydratase [Pseudomonadota bacterium]NOG61286.1 crotonase/enoyl-CoA hydratase family protein [Pseudomonadota bacterium]
MNTVRYSSEVENFEQFNLKTQTSLENNLDEYHFLHQKFDRERRILWLYMKPEGRQCFSINLLKDMMAQHELLLENHGIYYHEHIPYKVHYQVLTSEVGTPYNLGGDLELFIKYIKAKDRTLLREYAKLCINVLHPTAINFDSTIKTISLVRGQALGGGFESALSSSLLVAEKSAKLGLPEVLFNLFPGMGAYHLLARRLPTAQVEKMILSGRVYDAKELYDMGVVDILAEDGEGEKVIYDYVDKHKRHINTQIGLQKARQIYQPITHSELMRVCDVWVDAAMQLESRDLRVMERLVKAQYRMGYEKN